MQTHPSTTPFWRRSLTLAHVATQAAAKSRPVDTAVHKWQVFRDICASKTKLCVSERALAVLDALLTFHPETALSGKALIVFPSNHQLGLRAHGMAPATLRRHLGILVEAGLVIRRDSPNGKRYARKGRDGEIERAFGFDLSPLVIRAEEFAQLAEAVRAEERAFKLAKERVTLCRRDIVKMIAVGIEEAIPTSQNGAGPANWAAIHAIFRTILDRLPRGAQRQEVEPIAEELGLLADEITKLLEDHVNSQNKSGNESQTERHIQNSNPKNPIESGPRFSENDEPKHYASPPEIPRKPTAFPLGMVLDACPDLIDYAKGGITNWRDFFATVAVVRPMLGISPTAWEDALDALGEQHGSIVVAAILQKGAEIASAGGYLRDLTRRARAGEFNIGPMLMALLSARHKRTRLRA